MRRESTYRVHAAATVSAVAAVLLALVAITGEPRREVQGIDAESAAVIRTMEGLQGTAGHSHRVLPEWIANQNWNEPRLLMPCVATDAAVRFVAEHYSKLVCLDVQHSAVTDAGLEALADLEPLRLLVLGDAPVTEEGVERSRSRRPECVVRRFSRGIVYLVCSPVEYGRRPFDPPEFELTGLAHVEIRPTLQDEAELRSLLRFGEIESLFADGVPLSDSSLALFAKLPRLRGLVITGAPRLTEWGLAHLHGHPELRRLRCESPAISPEALGRLTTATPACRILSRWTPEEVAGFRCGARCNVSRASVQMSSQEQKTIADLSGIGMDEGRWGYGVDEYGRVNQLQFFRGARRIDDHHAATIGQLSHLEELWIYGHHASYFETLSITTAGLRSIARLPSLKYLELAGYCGTTSEMVTLLAEAKALRQVHFSGGCVSQGDRDRLQALRPELLIEWTPGY